jgi:hypothetical protein
MKAKRKNKQTITLSQQSCVNKKQRKEGTVVVCYQTTRTCGEVYNYSKHKHADIIQSGYNIMVLVF